MILNKQTFVFILLYFLFSDIPIIIHYYMIIIKNNI